MLANVPFSKNSFIPGFWKKELHISFGLPGHLWAAFELKIELPTSNVQLDAATLTLNALIIDQKDKKHKNAFLFFPKFSKTINNKSGALIPQTFFDCRGSGGPKG